VTSLVGRSSKAYPGEPREKVDAFLKENYQRFGLRQNIEDLQIVDARSNTFSINVELQQFFKTLPVENARVQVNFDKAGYVVQVVNSYVPPVDTSEEASVPKERAISLARQEFSRLTPIYKSKVDEQEQANAVRIDPKDIKLAAPIKVDDVYFVSKDQLRRAYKTYIRASIPFGTKEIFLDAKTGDVLLVKDFIFDAVDGQGKVFVPNPVNSLNFDGLRDDDDSNLAVFNNPGHRDPYKSMPLFSLDDADSANLFHLKGPFVVLVNLEDPPDALPAEAAANGFNYERNSKSFEDVMVYYHIDRMQRYIQAPLGFTNVMNRPIRADAHACYLSDNSRYVSSPETRGYGDLLFGDGGVDDAEDADVIAHEYGHAIQDNQTYGKYETSSLETRAMAEGFADYWAISTYKTETEASGHKLRYVMEWDHAPFLREVTFKTAPVDPGLSAHLNGIIWSSTLLGIVKKLDSKEIADKLILQSHFNVPTGPTFEQGADAILAADWTLFNGEHVGKLCEVFTLRQIYRGSVCSTAPPPS
jgi:hypothetical protein